MQHAKASPDLVSDSPTLIWKCPTTCLKVLDLVRFWFWSGFWFWSKIGSGPDLVLVRIWSCPETEKCQKMKLLGNQNRTY